MTKTFSSLPIKTARPALKGRTVRISTGTTLLLMRAPYAGAADGSSPGWSERAQRVWRARGALRFTGERGPLLVRKATGDELRSSRFVPGRDNEIGAVAAPLCRGRRAEAP